MDVFLPLEKLSLHDAAAWCDGDFTFKQQSNKKEAKVAFKSVLSVQWSLRVMDDIL